MGPIDDPTVQGVNQEPKISMNFNNETQQVETFLRTPGNPTPYKVPGTNEEWGNFIDQYMPIQIPKPTPPDQLSQDTLDLYRKAINEPNSLTQEETLIHTRMVFGKLNLPAEKKDLWLAAQKAAKGPRYATAETNARREGYRIDDERGEALSRLSDDDKNNISMSMHIPWIVQLMASSKSHWGFVCFRTAYGNDEAWRKYKEHILHCSHVGLWWLPGTGSLEKKWKIHFVEDDKEKLDAASLEDLCKYFRDPPSSSSISAALSSGLRSDVFLFANAHAISSLTDPPSDPWPEALIPALDAPPRDTDHLLTGYVNVCDASYEPSRTYSFGFKGSLKVHPAHISTTFYHRLWPRGQEKGAEDWWYYKRSIEDMFKFANGSSSR